jgi:hypothetical protein
MQHNSGEGGGWMVEGTRDWELGAEPSQMTHLAMQGMMAWLSCECAGSGNRYMTSECLAPACMRCFSRSLLHARVPTV